VAAFHLGRITFASGDVQAQSGVFNVFGPLAAVTVKLPGSTVVAEPAVKPAAVGSGSQFTVRRWLATRSGTHGPRTAGRRAGRAWTAG